MHILHRVIVYFSMGSLLESSIVHLADKFCHRSRGGSAVQQLVDEGWHFYADPAITRVVAGGIILFCREVFRQEGGDFLFVDSGNFDGGEAREGWLFLYFSCRLRGGSRCRALLSDHACC